MFEVSMEDILGTGVIPPKRPVGEGDIFDFQHGKRLIVKNGEEWNAIDLINFSVANRASNVNDLVCVADGTRIAKLVK